jgi:hypothetical protein
MKMRQSAGTRLRVFVDTRGHTCAGSGVVPWEVHGDRMAFHLCVFLGNIFAGTRIEFGRVPM